MGRFDYSAGGVGRNICEALGKLGCHSHFISAIGDDYQGMISLFVSRIVSNLLLRI